jgi:glycosyltransferase involved in cell wall biosynthesis
MKTSILLPTRNRLDYLKLAIETVLRQDSPEWEIAISDNDSSEDIGGHVDSLKDKRISYRRTQSFVPVTENWNAALEMSSGDYCVMLGDDDGLLPGYLARMRELVDEFDGPDLIYTGSLLFTYPDVDPQSPDGYLQSNSYGELFGDASHPFVLPREQAFTAVRKAMQFRLAFNFNMQLSLVSRGLIDRLAAHGDFFQSPFPDFYATCVALLKADRVVIDPRPQVIIGVTPKSYGFYHLNQKEHEGRAFLNADGDAQPQLPGTNINEGWLGAMEAIEANYGAEFGLRVNRRRYRVVQAGHVYTRRFRGIGSDAEVEQLERSLGRGERLLFRGVYTAARALAKLLPQRLWNLLSRHALGQFPGWDPTREEGAYTNVLEVFEQREGA